MSLYNKKHMLVVEEKNRYTTALENIFKDEFTLISAVGKADALDKIEEYFGDIAVVLIDLSYKTKGLELLYEIENSPYKSLPIIAIAQDVRYQQTAMDNGAWDFITSPTDILTTRARVENVISRYEVIEQIQRENGADNQEQNERKLQEQNERKLLELNAQMFAFINDMSVGVAIFRLVNPIEVCYFSDGLSSLLNFNRGDLAEKLSADPIAFIYEKDRARLLKSVKISVELGVPLDDTIRLITANSQPLKVRVSGKIIYDEDGTPMLNIIFIASSKKMQSYDDLLNYTTHAIYISDADTYEMLYLNRTGAKLFGQEGESYLGKKCYEVLYGYKSPCQFCKVEKMSDEKFLERDSYSAMLGKTFHLWGKLLKWENATAHVEYMEDVSEARRISNQNANLTKQLSMVIENIPSAMGLYRFDGSKVSLVTYNQAFFELMGYSEKNMNAAKNGDTMINIHPEDALTLMEKSKDGIFRSRTLKHTYRVFSDAKGQYIWVKLNGLVVPELDGTKLCYITYVDVSEERNALEKLGETSGLLQAALHSANVAVGEIEVENNRLIRLKSSRDSANSELIIENMPESVIEKGYIHQDSVEDFRELYRQMYRGENCQKDIMVTSKGRADAWWERIIFTPVFNSNGVFTKAISTSMDVSEQKKLEAIYKELETIRAETADGLMLNISKNKVDSMYSTSDVFISLNTGDVDDFLKNTLKNIPTAEKRREFLTIYTRPTLLKAYSLGKTVLSLETLYNVGENGKDVYRYSELNLRLTKHPYTGDIMGYAYLLDVHDRHTMQTVVDKIVSQDFSFIMLLDMEKNSTKLISGKMSVYKEQESNITYDQSIIKFFDKYVVEEDRERCKKISTVASIKEKLEQSDQFDFTFTIPMEDGTTQVRKMRYTYMDSSKKSVLVTSEDVTVLFRNEQQKNMQLSAALKREQLASESKSEFLSNMSHDMRTPMNAIISFSSMAVEEKLPYEEMCEYMEKISTSGRYLLQLINNVLDMSKIENNKMTLNLEFVKAKDLFSGVVSSIKPLMDAKNIDFRFESTVFEDDKAVYVDKLHIQQVYINLLSNAAKFTPKGGQVVCHVDTNRRIDGTVHNRTVITDNGCGMSDEFIKRAFLPFEQEKFIQAEGQTGTGLGLAIVKNLVELMGGSIYLESTLGVGTKITFEIDSQIPENENQFNDKSSPSQGEIIDTEKIFFYGKRVLLCEDHPLNTEIAKKLLERKGFSVDVAMDGTQGVNLFRQSENGFYSAILMDIRMPVMDGLQASEAIRKMDRQDAKTIPILAMTANAFDDDVRKSFAAGMNAHLAKPIEPAKLYSQLYRLIKR